MKVRARDRTPLVVAAVGVLALAGLAGGTSSAGIAHDTPAAAHLVVNEVDYDNVGTDTQEFVEIFNGTGAGVPLADFAVVLVNGGNNLEYSRTMLAAAGTCLPAGGYLVIAGTEPSRTMRSSPAGVLSTSTRAVSLSTRKVCATPIGTTAVAPASSSMRCSPA